MYRVIIEKKALNFFKKLDRNNQERIGKKIVELKLNPRLGIPLVGNLAGFWKLRVGDYRLIYDIKNDQLIIVIFDMGNRKNIYD